MIAPAIGCSKANPPLKMHERQRVNLVPVPRQQARLLMGDNSKTNSTTKVPFLSHYAAAPRERPRWAKRQRANLVGFLRFCLRPRGSAQDGRSASEPILSSIIPHSSQRANLVPTTNRETERLRQQSVAQRQLPHSRCTSASE